MRCFLGWIGRNQFGLIGALVVTLLASIPVYSIRYLPSIDGPNHWMIVKVVIETLRGRNPGWELVFVPGYKLFYYVNTPLFFLAELIGFRPTALPSLSTIFLHFLFATLVGLKLISVLNNKAERSEKLSYILGIVLSLSTTFFASLALYSSAYYWGFIGFVYSVPFTVLTILVFEDCMAFFDHSKFVALALLLFLSYTAHPLSLFFLTTWVLIRMIMYYIMEAAKGSKISLKSSRPFGSFFICVFVLAILHQVSFPKVVGLDFENIVQSWLHPFRPIPEVYYYLKGVFLRADGFTAGYVENPNVYTLLGLVLLMGSTLLNFILGGWRASSFQINLTIIFFLLINAFFIHDILPAHYPIGVFYRERLPTICFPIAFTIAGYSIIANQQIMKNWIIVASIIIVVLFGAIYHTWTLYKDFDRFNTLSQKVYIEMISEPKWNKDYANSIYFYNQFYYRFGEHFHQYACLHDRICKEKLFHESLPDFGIYPLRPTR